MTVSGMALLKPRAHVLSHPILTVYKSAKSELSPVPNHSTEVKVLHPSNGHTGRQGRPAHDSDYSLKDYFAWYS